MAISLVMVYNWFTSFRCSAYNATETRPLSPREHSLRRFSLHDGYVGGLRRLAKHNGSHAAFTFCNDIC
ncbi:MAG: hypothetical protein JWM58_3114 [Rhizobium sp.]|nr:hypothetical protein [Rhizobium sp.]